MTSLDSLGRIEGKTFIYPVRIYFEDTDAGGLVYHANYLKYIERARTEASRYLGVGHSENFNKGGTFFVVRRLEIDYIKPAYLDDVLEIHTTFSNMTRVRLDVSQDIYRHDELIAQSKVFLASVDQTGKPARINDEFSSVLKDHI